MPDTHQAGRQDVEKEPPDELLGMEGHGLLRVGISTIPVRERDAVVGGVEDSGIGNGRTVRVAAQIREDAPRRRERALGINDPPFMTYRGEQLSKAERGGARKIQFSGAVGGVQKVEKLGAKDDSQGRDGEQKAGACRRPAVFVVAKRAAGNDAVDVIVTAQCLIPGVEHPEKTDASLQVGATEIDQGFGDRLEENADQEFRIPHKQRIQFMGNGKDQVEVAHGQEFLFPTLKPAVCCGRAALGTVSVAAAVVEGRFGAAVVTPLHVPAQCGCPAGLDGAENFPMNRRQLPGLAVVFPIQTEHVGQFPSRP
jgi:hypothetical protein